LLVTDAIVRSPPPLAGDQDESVTVCGNGQDTPCQQEINENIPLILALLRISLRSISLKGRGLTLEMSFALISVGEACQPWNTIG
jgi:hypothetical protein